MQTKHARILFVLSIFLLSLVVIDFVKISKNNSIINSTQKSVPNLVAKVDEIGQVLSGGVYYYRFELKESGQTTSLEGATATVLNTSSFQGTNQCTTSDGSTPTNTFYYVSSYYELLCGTNVSMTVSVSKSGYQTKEFVLSYDSTPGSPTDNLLSVQLEKNTSTSNPPTVSTTKKTKTTTITPETIKNVVLPDSFKTTGVSTDLAAIVDTAKVEDLTLDSETNTIKFAVPVDLSATDTKDKFKTLDTYVKVDKVGVISIDSTNLPALNKPATLTMKGLSFLKTPKVLVDGKEDKSVVSNIKYKDGELIFDVTHFSTFTAAPTVGINEPANNFETNNKTVTLKGTISDPTASVSAKLNNKNLGKLKIATSGAFQKDIDLEEGLNKIVVSALGANFATASASVSGTLLINVNSLINPLNILLALLGILAIGMIVWTFKHLKKNMDSKIKENSKPENPLPPMKTPIIQ